MKALIFLVLFFSCSSVFSSQLAVNRGFLKEYREATFTTGVCAITAGMWEQAIINKNEPAKKFLRDYMKDKLLVKDYKLWEFECDEAVSFIKRFNKLYDLDIDGY